METWGTTIDFENVSRVYRISVKGDTVSGRERERRGSCGEEGWSNLLVRLPSTRRRHSFIPDRRVNVNIRTDHEQSYGKNTEQPRGTYTIKIQTNSRHQNTNFVFWVFFIVFYCISLFLFFSSSPWPFHYRLLFLLPKKRPQNRLR